MDILTYLYPNIIDVLGLSFVDISTQWFVVLGLFAIFWVTISVGFMGSYLDEIFNIDKLIFQGEITKILNSKWYELDEQIAAVLVKKNYVQIEDLQHMAFDWNIPLRWMDYALAKYASLHTEEVDYVYLFEEGTQKSVSIFNGKPYKVVMKFGIVRTKEIIE